MYCNSARVMMKMSLQSRMLSKISSSISTRGRRGSNAQQVVDDELDRSIYASSSSARSSSRTRTRHTTKKSHSDMFHRLHLLNRLPNTTDIKCDSSQDNSSTTSSKHSESSKKSKRSRMFRIRRDSLFML